VGEWATVEGSKRSGYRCIVVGVWDDL